MKIVNQRTRLTIDPLAVIVQPSSTITFIPNEKIIATEALNKPQIKPAMATRRIVGPAMAALQQHVLRFDVAVHDTLTMLEQMLGGEHRLTARSE